MKTIKGTITEQNLLKAFAGESQARNRYSIFAEVAKKEGYEQISGIFLETADQEKAHAKRFFDYLEGGMVMITGRLSYRTWSAIQLKTYWKQQKEKSSNGLLYMPISRE